MKNVNHNASKTRYRYYREHKYISFMLSEFERLVAQSNFRNKVHVDFLLDQLDGIEDLLKSHAEWEESAIHELLRKKNLDLHREIELDHKEHNIKFKKLREILNSVVASSCEHEKLEFGYQFYLLYRKFVGDNLIHLHHEETVIMPALHKVYSDDELRSVEFRTYCEMQPEHMVDMMLTLFPHMNLCDREFFLREIKNAEPVKFLEAWESISNHLESDERDALMKILV
jgi:hypothetical protein